MNRFFAFLLLAVVATSASAFTVAPITKVAGARPASAYAQASTFSTSTALNLKIKVDPNEPEDRVNPAVFKNAAYLGSIALALLLPFFFLVSASK